MLREEGEVALKKNIDKGRCEMKFEKLGKFCVEKSQMESSSLSWIIQLG